MVDNTSPGSYCLIYFHRNAMWIFL